MAYVKTTDFAVKDSLLSGDPDKIVRGSEIDAEFAAIESAVNDLVAPQTHAATTKITPVDADELPLSDSAASWGLKNLTWANLKATLKTWIEGTPFAGIGFSSSARITGDFSNATWSSQVAFKSSTTNGGTTITAIPNGSGTGAGFAAAGDSTLTNFAYTAMSVTAAASVFEAGKYGTGSYLPMVFYAGGAERVRIDTSGNAGLGVATSAWRSGDRALDIGTTVSLVDAQGANSRLYNNTYVAAGGTNTYKTTAAASYYDQGAGIHRWFSAASGTAGNPITFTQAMTLDASGNLGLGVTPSAWAAPLGGTVIEGRLGASFTSRSDSASVSVGLNWYHNGSSYIYKNSNYATRYEQTNGTHVWSTAPSGTAGNTITFTQALSVGHGTTLALAGATSQTGTGITFPATQSASSDANTLDDYEEGTWTPTQGAGLTVVGAFSSNGHYTKVGRQVVAQGYVQGATSVAVTANGVICGGLPFAAMNVTGSHFIGGASNGNLTALANVWVNQNSAVIYAVTAISATPGIYFTVTYLV